MPKFLFSKRFPFFQRRNTDRARREATVLFNFLSTNPVHQNQSNYTEILQTYSFRNVPGHGLSAEEVNDINQQFEERFSASLPQLLDRETYKKLSRHAKLAFLEKVKTLDRDTPLFGLSFVTSVMNEEDERVNANYMVEIDNEINSLKNPANSPENSATRGSTTQESSIHLTM